MGKKYKLKDAKAQVYIIPVFIIGIVLAFIMIYFAFRRFGFL